jgi:hypothetical protein
MCWGRCSTPPSRLANYVLPGLDSTLLSQGRFRLFTSSRYTEEFITPHSHRYDFACLVLRGKVTNTIYRPRSNEISDAQLWARSQVLFRVEAGQHVYTVQDPINVLYSAECKVYGAGEVYSQLSADIHSIRFSKDAVVLFLEAPERTGITHILEPVHGGKRVPTFKTEDWMFSHTWPEAD